MNFWTESPESSIISNSLDNTLYKNDDNKGIGTYFNVKFNDEIVEKELKLSSKIKISVYYIKNKDYVGRVYIKKYTLKGSEWILDKEINLSRNGFDMLKDILQLLNDIDLKGISDRKISLGTSLNDVKIDNDLKNTLKTLFQKNEGKEILQEVIDTENISSGDIVGLGYKKDQIKIFEKLLHDDNYFEEYKNENNLKGPENVWQYFFEKNKRIFGYGLTYLWLSGMEDGKLEQVVAGHNFNSAGKRVDGLLSTVSDIKKFVLVEIKKHNNTDLIGEKYREETWVPGKDLIGGVAHLQKSIHKFKKVYFEKADIKDKSGNPIESIFNIMPKSYLIIGKLAEFKTDKGINEDKYSSFELYRNNISGIEVITYDELYERAKYIVENIKK